MSQSSGRILLRTDSKLHQKLLSQAQSRNCSLNELCCEKLAFPLPLEGSSSLHMRELVILAQDLFMEQLQGVVLFGSQARGEGRSESDWDVLLVMHPETIVARELYRRWDDAGDKIPLPLEVHFAHLPLHSKVATGFWSEIALDGIILYESDLSVSRHLGKVRREIADGSIIRKTSHGQSYWVYREVA